MTEETPKEFTPRCPQERTQTIPVSASHRRFADTRLWKIAHYPGFASGDLAPADIDTALDEFMLELESYGREETNLLQRMRTLRFTRSRLLATARKRTHHEAGKKCGYLFSSRPHRPRR